MQIKEKIQEEIQNEEANAPIESERILSERLGASRMTVRKAIEELVEEGVLYREDKKGTFVSDRSLWKKNTTFINSEDTDLEYRLINFDIKISADKEVLEQLNIKDSDSVSIIRIVRKILENKKPQSVEEFYIIRSFIDDKDTNKFNKLLDLNNYLKDNIITQKFVPMIVPTKYAAMLNLSLDAPIIKIEGVVKTKSAEPFIYYKIYNNPEQKNLEMTL